MNKVFIFQGIGKPGKKYWYDNIGLRYNMNIKNQATTTDSSFFNKKTLNSFRNGIKHSIPISSSFKILKYFTFNQNLNLSDRWYFNQIEKNWDTITHLTKTDTIHKFTRGMSYNLSSSINTKIYGIAQFKKGKIAAFRHVMTPNLSFNYNPSFEGNQYGIYKTVQINTEGETESYSIMENGIYGSPSKNKSGNINHEIITPGIEIDNKEKVVFLYKYALN